MRPRPQAPGIVVASVCRVAQVSLVLALLVGLLFFGQASLEGSVSSTLARAVQYIEGKNPAKALAVLSGYRASPEELSDYHHTYARAFEGAGMFHNALAHYRLAFVYAAEGPARERMLLERADFFIRRKHYPEALLAFRVFLGGFPGSPHTARANLGVADALYRTGRYAQAHAHYRMAGGEAAALSGRAKALHFLGRLRESSEIFQSLLDNDRSFLRSSQESVYVMGENLRLLGKLPEAKLYLSTVVDKPWKQWAERSLGLIAVEEGASERAFKLLESAAKTADRKLKSEAVLDLAELGIKIGRTDEAKSRLLEIRKGYPFGRAYDRALISLSRIHRAEGQTRESEKLLNELVFRQNPPKEALDEMQAVLVTLADKDRAELSRVWRSAGKRLLEPERSEALLAIAGGLRDSGRPYIELLEWLLKYGSAGAKVRSRLAMAEFYAGLGEVDAASRYLSGARLGGTSNDLLRAEARVSLTRGEYQKSFAALRSLKELTSTDVTILAELAGPLGREKAFLDFFGRWVETASPGPALHLRVADAAASAGRRTEATDHYRAALAHQEKTKGKRADDGRWCLYRLARLSPGPEGVDALRKMESGSDVFSRYSRAALKEHSLSESMERIF